MFLIHRSLNSCSRLLFKPSAVPLLLRSNTKVFNARAFAKKSKSQQFSSLSLMNLEDDLAHWPRSKVNTVLNVCPQGQAMVVERLGKFHTIQTGGFFFSIPYVDRIRFIVDLREKALAISPQSAITKDNVHVKVSGNVYCQFLDAERAAYGSTNPIYAVRQHAQSAMRAAIGEMELDEILHARAQLNTMIKESVQGAAQTWGLEIKRYEITEILPDKYIMEAMDKQAAAERERRKKVLDAEGDKRSAELQSEGEKIRMKNESEGMLIKTKNEAEARKIQLVLEAEGEATAVELKATADARAIEIIGKVLDTTSGSDAAKLQVAQKYITMYGQIGQTSNTMIFNDRPADVNSLMAHAATVISATAHKKQ